MKVIERTLSILVMILTILLANRGIWLCLTDLNDPLSFCSYNYPGQEIILYFFTACLAIWLIMHSRKGKIFIGMWRRNIVILAFISLAMLSILWSVYPVSTLYHLLILLFSTLLAAFVGTYFSSDRLLLLLAAIGGIIVITSGILWIFFPHAAIMGPPHLGSWRGIYWHKNFTGSLMAFWNAIFLLYELYALRGSLRWQAGASAILYLLSLIFILISQSAAGIAIWLGLNLTILIALLWNKIRGALKKQHYALFGYTAVILIVLIATNLNFVFGLLNREASLTGRIPLWNYLIKTIVIQRPLLGYGFSAIWDVREFRDQVTLNQGWPFIITNGHNGFLDVLLGLGSVGLMLAMVLFILALYHTGRLFILDNRAENLLPLVIVVYFFLSNMSISFFLGIESFHWVLLIAALFIVPPTTNNKIQ